MIYKMLKRLGLGVVALGLAFGVYFAAIQLTGNFAEVLPGELYRSAQPSGADITRYAERYGIKTVINLRGASEKDWYKQEADAAGKAGIKLINFPMSARKPLTLAQVDKLIGLMKDAPKPILIHCKSGSDRTGLVSVIYLQQLGGVDEETAEQQLSIRFGHLGIPYLSSTHAMDDNWEDLEKHFGLPS